MRLLPVPDARMATRVGALIAGGRAPRLSDSTTSPMRHTGTPAALVTASACSRGTAITMPTPMLKVRHISSAMTPPARSIAVKSAGTSQRGAVDHRAEAGGQHAGDVLDEAAAGDVRHGADVDGLAQLADGVQVAAVRLEEEVGERSVGAGERGVPVELALEHDVAHQRVAVGVQPAAGHRQEHVAGLDARAVDDAVALDRADDEAGDVVVAERVDAGHLGGLAADQRAAGVATRRGDARRRARRAAPGPACRWRSSRGRRAARRRSRGCR